MNPSSQDLIHDLANGEIDESSLEKLAILAKSDPSLTRSVAEELEFSELIRQAVTDHSLATQDILEQTGPSPLSTEDLILLATEGELTPLQADRLARQLHSQPELAHRLLHDLQQDEWLTQSLSSQKTETAFIQSLETRMWAETKEDDFVSNLELVLEQQDHQQAPPESADNVLSFPGLTKRHFVATIGIAAALAVGAFFLVTHLAAPSSAFVANVTKATPDAHWAAHTQPVNNQFSEGTYELLSGLVSLEFSNGENLVIEGPAKFNVNPNGQATFFEGLALAEMGMSGNSPALKLVGNNLQFTESSNIVGFDARREGTTEAIVFTGNAGVCLTESDDCRRVFSKEAIQVDHRDQDRLVDVPYNPRAFNKAWQLLAGVASNQGDVVIQLPGTQPQAASSGQVEVYLENRSFISDQSLLVDAVEPGKFADLKAEQRAHLVAANTPMSSYLLHVSADESDAGESVEASLTFDQPVIGVIFSSDKLEGSDPYVGVTPGSFAKASASGSRGLDAQDDDQVLLSEDGKTLNLRISAQNEIDQIRVLVAADSNG
ncbi:MAG: hypothetical protein AAF226_09450 [Verrucomicrobiota bacterium]